MDLSAALNQLKNQITGTTGGQASESTQEVNHSSSYENKEKEVSVFSNTASILEENLQKSEKDSIEELEESFNEIMNFLDEHSNKELSIEQNPVNTDEIKTASKKVSAGDVFEVPGENGLFIKTSSGDYKKLGITSDTYEKLFGEGIENGGSFGRPSDGFEFELLSDNIEKLFENSESRELVLSCFSEDDKGNITFTLPNSNSSFTLEKGKSLSDYDLDMEYSDSPIGYGMIELALGSQRCEKELDLLYENQKYSNEIISEEEKNHSKNLTNTMKEALNFAENDRWLMFEIQDYYDLVVNDASEEEIKDVVGEDIYNIMQNVPKEEFKNANPDYIYSLIWKELDAEEIQELEEDPYFSNNRNNAIDETQMLSAFGLNKNYEKINDKTLKQAEQYIKELKLYTTPDFDEKVLATLIDDNEKGIEIIEYIKENENKDINYFNLQTCLEKSLIEDTDTEFLKKLTDLNIESSIEYLLSEDLISENNIDLVLEWQDTNKVKKDNREHLTIEELEGLNIATTLFDNKEISEYMKGDNFDSFIDAALYSNSILENEYKDDGTTRSNLLKEELKMVLDAALNGQDPNDIAVPSVKSIAEGIEATKMGDVFEVEGEDSIYFTINDKECIQLDISKDTFNKLFPPIQKYMSQQGDVGDCYLVSTLNNMMTDPSMRGTLLQCFSEDENGNITVDLPNGDYTFTLENGKEVTDYEDRWLLSDSSTGMQMLELCYGIYAEDVRTEEILDDLTYITERMEEESESYSYSEKLNASRIAEIIYNDSEEDASVHEIMNSLEAILYENANVETIVSEKILPFADEGLQKELANSIEKIKDSNVTSDYIYDLMYSSAILEELDIIKNDEYGTYVRGNGGFNEDVFEAFGIECDSLWLNYSHNDSELDELLNNPNIKIVAGGTYGNSDTIMLNKELNIAGSHAYTIYPKQQENGEYLFEVINPWDESSTSILDKSQLLEYFDSLDYVYI